MTSWHLVLHTLIRWLNFMGVALFVGGIAFRYLVVRPGLAAGPLHNPGVPDRRLLTGALGLTGLAGLADFGLRARMMSPTMDLTTLLPLVLRSTHLGHVWLFKLGLLAALWGLVIRRPSRPGGGSLQTATVLAVTAGLGLAQALGGHAADRGALTLAVLADWLHVMATTVWAGGLLWLRLLLSRPDERLTAETLRRFSRVAATCVGVLVATGLVSAFQQIAAPAALVTTSYGRTLVLKVMLVSVMVGLGGLARFYILPGLTGRGGLLPQVVTRGVEAVVGKVEGAAALTRRARLLIGLECVIGLAVLVCAAILTQTPPPRAGMVLSPPHAH